MDGELLREVIQRVKAVAGVKAFLVLSVASLHLSVVARRVGTDELVPDAQFCGGGFKQSGQLLLAAGETVGEFNAIVGLDTLHPDAPAGVPLEQPFEEVSGRVGALLGVGGSTTRAGRTSTSGRPGGMGR